MQNAKSKEKSDRQAEESELLPLRSVDNIPSPVLQAESVRVHINHIAITKYCLLVSPHPVTGGESSHDLRLGVCFTSLPSLLSFANFDLAELRNVAAYTLRNRRYKAADIWT